MFKGMPDRSEKAAAAARWLANHKNFKSHGRHISRADLQAHQLKVTALEEDDLLQDMSLSVFHATTHTFTGTPAVKIVENHTGRAFIKQQAVQIGIGPNQLIGQEPLLEPPQ